MAAKTLYAWTDIVYADKDGKRQTLRRGETVTAAKLNVEEDELNELVFSRALRQTKYPDMPRDYTGSPREFILEERRRQLADIDDLEDALAAAEVEALQDTDEVVEEAPEEDK